jgi:hypothetical protein
MTNQVAATHFLPDTNMSQTPKSHIQQMDLSQLQVALAESLRAQDLLRVHLDKITASSASLNECLFFDRLAPEIRNHIYGYLLINPILSTAKSASLSPVCIYVRVRYHLGYLSLVLLDFTPCCDCIFSKSNANMFSRTPTHVPKTILTYHLQS